ncbi:MAG: lantibiotic dehydratase [Pseudonocardiaceae bacterium]
MRVGLGLGSRDRPNSTTHPASWRGTLDAPTGQGRHRSSPSATSGCWPGKRWPTALYDLGHNLTITATRDHLYLVSMSRRRVVEPQVFHSLALDKQPPPLARFLPHLPRAFSTARYQEVSSVRDIWWRFSRGAGAAHHPVAPSARSGGPLTGRPACARRRTRGKSDRGPGVDRAGSCAVVGV